MGLRRLNNFTHNEVKCQRETKQNSPVDYWRPRTRGRENIRFGFEITYLEVIFEEQMEDLEKYADSLLQKDCCHVEPYCLLCPNSPFFARLVILELDS